MNENDCCSVCFKNPCACVDRKEEILNKITGGMLDYVNENTVSHEEAKKRLSKYDCKREQEITVLGNGFVRLIDYCGSDLSVVNAARVSMGKRKTVFDESDEKLIMYLAKNKHTSPFRHAFLSFHVKCPLFVKGQFDKHQVGISINTISGRYVQTADDWYEPQGFRQAADNVKQGSKDTFITDPDLVYMLNNRYRDHFEDSMLLYDAMIEAGVCREQARTILPQGMNTEFYMSGSLQAFVHFIKLRTDAHAQKEIRDYGFAFKQIVEPLFPISLKALLEFD
jgi:thymidylate synthase (FAD)